MPANLLRLGACLLSLLAECTRNDALNGSSQPHEETFMQAQAQLQHEPNRTRLPIEGMLPSLDAATMWLNSPPLAPAALRGKVVLVQFWTYTCINWRRTMPYIRAWSEKYKASGLVMLGVHTPEFDFEKDVENVLKFTRDADIAFPIAIDSERAIWRAFNNEYWPALYFIDTEGRIRHHQFGEGDYDVAETVIQQLLAESGHGGVPLGLAYVRGSGAEAAAAWADLRSGENYLGYARTQGLLTTIDAKPGRAQIYPEPPPLRLNQWSLSGAWTIDAEAATLNAAGGRLTFRFHARDVHLVMGATTAGTNLPFRVRLDGQPPGAAHGVDVDEQGNGTVSQPRMYQLIRQAGPIMDRTLEIELLGAPLQAFSLTFG